MRYFYPGIILLLLFMAFNNAHAENRFVLKVLSYNVWGLPCPISCTKTKRFKQIGRLLRDRRLNGDAPHIVLLQEAFTRTSKWINYKAGYPFYMSGPGKGKGTILGSGLRAYSEFPINEKRKFTFGHKNADHADKYANKGVQSFQIQVPEVPFAITIMNTHMQAQQEFDYLRIRQQLLMKNFVYAGMDDAPVTIFPGDFNIKTSRESFHHFVRTYPEFGNAGGYCLENPTQCFIDPETKEKDVYESTVDHQWYYVRDSHHVRVRPIYISRNFNKKYKGKELSDHLGHEVHYEISWD